MTRLSDFQCLRAARLAVLTLATLVIPQVSHAYEPLGDTNCGQLGQYACLPGSSEWLEYSTPCDRGLNSEWWWSDGHFHCVNNGRQSAPVNDRTSKALRMQRELQADSALVDFAVLSGHNAFNNISDGYLSHNELGMNFTNQQYSITDQLRMGIRRLTLDIHWVNNALRLCHANMDLVPGEHFGCVFSDRPYFQLIEELKQWMLRPENSQEVVFLDLEAYTEGHYAELVAPIEAHLKDLVARRTELTSVNVSINQLRALGKRLIIVGPAEANTTLFVQEEDVALKPLLGRETHPVKDFVASTCGYNAAGATSLPYPVQARYDFGEDSTVYNFEPFESYNGPQEVGVITPEVLRQLTACPIPVISLDQVTPDKIQHAVWSWDVNKPNEGDNDTDCVSMSGTGRWSDTRCGELRRFACGLYDETRRTAHWKVTAAAGTWQQGASQCASEYPGYEFAVPRTGYENKKLAEVPGSQNVWLNLNDKAIEGVWSSIGDQPRTVQLRSLGKCMADSSGQANTGANIILKGCNSDSSQKWILPGDGTIRSAINPSKCVDVTGSDNGGNISVWNCHNGDNQRWTLSGSFLRSGANWNRVIDVYGGSGADYGIRLQSWDYHGGVNQQWTLVPQ